jgi:hypothetical protein
VTELADRWILQDNVYYCRKQGRCHDEAPLDKPNGFGSGIRSHGIWGYMGRGSLRGSSTGCSGNLRIPPLPPNGSFILHFLAVDALQPRSRTGLLEAIYSRLRKRRPAKRAACRFRETDSIIRSQALDRLSSFVGRTGPARSAAQGDPPAPMPVGGINPGSTETVINSHI